MDEYDALLNCSEWYCELTNGSLDYNAPEQISSAGELTEYIFSVEPWNRSTDEEILEVLERDRRERAALDI